MFIKSKLGTKIISKLTRSSRSLPTSSDPLFNSDYNLLKSSSLFNTEFYLKNNLDVASTSIDPLMHYIVKGGYEGRRPSPSFDSRWYLVNYSDVRENNWNPLVHYIRYGEKEGRLPFEDADLLEVPEDLKADYRIIRAGNIFDDRFYLDMNPDVAASALDPLIHYCRYGWAEGRDPSPVFSTTFYLSQYPDIKAAGINPLSHWLRYGRAEGRKTSQRMATVRRKRDNSFNPSVIFVTHEASRTGAPIVLLNFLRWLRANTTIQFGIVVGARGPLDQEFAELAPCIFIRDFPSGSWRQELRDFCGNNVQLIYGNTVVSAVYIEHMNFFNAKYLIHLHEQENVLSMYEREVVELGKLNADFIVVSDSVLNAAQKRLPQAEVFHKLPPFIDTTSSKSAIGRSASQRKILITACGTVEERKGFDIFCDVARLIRGNASIDVEFQWIGPTSASMPDPDAIIREKGVSDIVQWLGPNSSPRELFAQSDIFILPSREDPFPLVCLEAASCGVPIICFDARAGGMHTFVGQDAGVVAEYLDTKSMAHACLKLINDPKLRREMGAAAKKKVIDHHSVDNVARKIFELFPPLRESDATSEFESYAEQISNAKVVSFDIFDTLITRLIDRPEVVFDIIEHEHTRVEAGSLPLLDERMRVAGEVLRSRNGAVDDVVIEEIYERMAIYRNPEIEKQIELQLCTPHPLGKKLFNYALSLKKPIIIASDMYLDRKTIEAMLKKAGYSGWTRLFLSSDTGRKKDTGATYQDIISWSKKFIDKPSEILHIGDNWDGDVKKARESGLSSLRFAPIYEQSGGPTELTNLTAQGRIWQSTCTQLNRLWALNHPELQADPIIRVGNRYTGPFAVMLALKVMGELKAKGLKKVCFLARDGRIIKTAFDKLFESAVNCGEVVSDYVSLSRATVVRATLQNPLTSNDLYSLIDGLHLEQKPVKFFLDKAGLDTNAENIVAATQKYFATINYVPKWEERFQLTELLRGLSDEIFAACQKQRAGLAAYLAEKKLLNEDFLIVDVGWLLNIQARLERFLQSQGMSSKIHGVYFGSNERTAKECHHTGLVFERGEPRVLAEVIQQNVTLFEVLFSSPEPAATDISIDSAGRYQLAFKKADLSNEEFQYAQKMHKGAKDFIDDFVKHIKPWFPEIISPDFLVRSFNELVYSGDEDIIAAFSSFSIALGGAHEFDTKTNLIKTSTAVSLLPVTQEEYFSPIRFGKSEYPRVVFVTSANLRNGSTRYRALNIAKALSFEAVQTIVCHSETPIDEFGALIGNAEAVIFQRCFYEQGNVMAFYRLARAEQLTCLVDFDDLVFPKFVKTIGSVVGGEWTKDDAMAVTTGYDALLKNVDGCIVSTGVIEKVVSEDYGLPVFRFPNLIESRFLASTDRRDQRKSIRLGYASGTRSHKNDFAGIEDVLFNFLAENRSTVELDIIGVADVGDRLLTLPNVATSPLLPYEEMLRALSELDLLLVPLEATIFNDGKSAIKFIEAGAVGVPVLASNVHEFALAIENEIDGLLANDGDEFRKYLQLYCRDRGLLDQLGKQANLKVQKLHTVESSRYSEKLVKFIRTRTRGNSRR